VNIIAVSNNLYDTTSIFQKDNVVYIRNKSELIGESIAKINPDYVFFPHWSYIIPQRIYENFNCILFHMTDLPFGRGGSPLQNLLERKIYDTKISAIKCSRDIDAGDIYLKRNFNISCGNAQEIYIRAAEIISEMIDEIINTKPVPVPQDGEVVEFKRRKYEQSNIITLDDIDSIYDYIRMLDAPGYPRAFIKINKIKYEFYKVNKINGKLTAIVEIIEEEK
jgi:methionyl-tRNA formyltransferase